MKNYGKLLNVNKFNLLHKDSAQLHLWYVINDDILLHKCLSQGLRTWGQLDSFKRLDGEIEGLTPEWISTIENKIRLLDRLIYLSRKGRAISIHREVLENSGAVSASFIDEVCEKMEELQGDPEALLEALENSEVSGFRRNNISKLRKYLSDQEIVDEDEPLSDDEIKIQLAAFISRLELDSNDAENFCNLFIFEDQTKVASNTSINS